MNILSVNIFPKYGSTGKLVWEIHQRLLRDHYNSVICYGRGKKIHDSSLIKLSFELVSKAYTLIARFTGKPYSLAYFETMYLIYKIKKYKPDIVHLHCLNCFYVNMYILLRYLKKNHIKTVLTMHAELMYTGGCAHAYDCNKWMNGCGNCPNLWEATHSYYLDKTNNVWKNLNDIYCGYDNITLVTVSMWLNNRASQSPFFINKKIFNIDNGINTEDIFKPTINKDLYEKYKNNNRKVLLHVNPLFNDPNKGSHFVIELAKRIIDKNIIIIIIGFKGDESILPINIKPIGLITDPVILAEYYTLSDLTLLVSKRETFSLVCAESLSCGTPIVGFKAGAPELIALKDYSQFVEYGNLDSLENSIYEWIDFKNKNSSDIISSIARKQYSCEKMYQEYVNLYSTLI